jgi:hypothetical protein
MKNNLAYHFFTKKEDCDLKSPQEFLEYLEENNLFNEIDEVMRYERNLFLYNGKKLKQIIKKIICISFKQFLLNIDETTEDKLKKIIINKIKFYDFIDLNSFLNPNDTLLFDKKDIFDKLVIFLYLKKIINGKNFINQL